MSSKFSSRSVRLAVQSKSWNPTQTEWKHAAQCIQTEEKERIGKFYFKKDAKSAMVGRLLMRYAVAGTLGVPYCALCFARTDKGKPYLTSPVDKCSPHFDLSFNISHQGEYVVYAGEKNRLVGVDVMNVDWPRNRPVSEFLDSMEKQLTAAEMLEIKSHQEEDSQLKTFFRLWCLKESLVKALGTGIGFSVNRLNFNFGTRVLSPDCLTQDTSVDIDGEPASDWTFEETVIEDHCVAVAVQDSQTNAGSTGNKKEVPVPFTVIDISELLSGCEPLAGSEPDSKYWEVFNAKEEEPR